MATSPNSGCPSVRVIIQQCLSARLQVQPPTENEDAQWVEVSGTLRKYRLPNDCKGTRQRSSLTNRIIISILLSHERSD